MVVNSNTKKKMRGAAACASLLNESFTSPTLRRVGSFRYSPRTILASRALFLHSSRLSSSWLPPPSIDRCCHVSLATDLATGLNRIRRNNVETTSIALIHTEDTLLLLTQLSTFMKDKCTLKLYNGSIEVPVSTCRSV